MFRKTPFNSFLFVVTIMNEISFVIISPSLLLLLVYKNVIRDCLFSFPSTILLCLLASLGRRQWHPTSVLLPGKSHGQRSLEGFGPWGRWGSDMTEQLHFHFSLSCIGEGNGNPLQCSCLENPRDRGTWWAAVYGVTQSRTRLKWLSSTSSFFADSVRIFKVAVTWYFFPDHCCSVSRRVFSIN